MRFHTSLVNLVCVGAGLASLAACGGKIKYPNYYVLNFRTPIPTASQTKPLPGSVAVREFRAPAFLRGGAIVYRKSGEQLDFYHYHRWAADPRSAVTTAVVQSMEAHGIFQSVHLYDGRETSEYLVTGALDHLEEVDQGHDVLVEAAISARLVDLKTGEVLWTDSVSETTKVENHAMPDVVIGMSRAAETAVSRLVSSMQNRIDTQLRAASN
ncbi:MAG TPA: ABC-type transport auxiliary lipoprotein family protein [Bryobacteraceae bacterium]|jgi:ABC-type uncharacterized transport system auxiliary subunit|nr:ABC-type transport auxiliary lipoprotein family protein [Bryobacteraceae bacterium]